MARIAVVIVGVLSVAVLARTAGAQTAAGVDLGVAAGGDTNDVQLSIGASLEMFRNARIAPGLEALYVRDFFEFEPDNPLTDALTYSGVTAVMVTTRVQMLSGSLQRTMFIPYAIAGAGWLHAAAADAASDHAGYVLGGGTDVLATRSARVALEVRRFATLGSSDVNPRHDAFSFWRVGVVSQFRWAP